jgi:hypothetical protein
MTRYHSDVQQLITNVTNNASIYPTSDSKFIGLSNLATSLTGIAEEIDGVIVSLPGTMTNFQAGGRRKSKRKSNKKTTQKRGSSRKN